MRKDKRSYKLVKILVGGKPVKPPHGEIVMRVFFDTEFTGLKQDTTLISVGLISEAGDTFYAELTDYNKADVNEWIKENVIDNLTLNDQELNKPNVDFNESNGRCKIRCDKENLKIQLSSWLSQFTSIEMWSDCLAYDWVLFNDIFGGAFEIPSHVYYIPFDICTLFKLKGIDTDINRERFAEVTSADSKHNALHDAEVIKMCYDKLMLI